MADKKLYTNTMDGPFPFRYGEKPADQFMLPSQDSSLSEPTYTNTMDGPFPFRGNARPASAFPTSLQSQTPQQQQSQPIVAQDYASYIYPKTTINPNQYLPMNPYGGQGTFAGSLRYPGIDETGFKQEQKALGNIGNIQADAQKKLANEDLDIGKYQQSQANKLEAESLDNASDYKRNTQDFDKQMEEVSKAYPSLSRQDVIDTYSTGKKLAAGLGIILGGISQGMLHTNTNQALDQFNAGVDSVIKKNNDNFNKQMQMVMNKQQKSLQDFQVGRQVLEDNTRMMANTLEGLKAQAQAHFLNATSPVQKFMAAQAAAQVQQKLDVLRQNTALQNFNLQLQQGAWAAGQINNDLNINVGVDQKTGDVVTARAFSKEAAEETRKGLNDIDNKFNAIQAMKEYLNHHSIREDAFAGKNLQAFKTMVEKHYGLKEGELPDPNPIFGRNATDFYQNMPGVLALQRQALIRKNTHQAASVPAK